MVMIFALSNAVERQPDRLENYMEATKLIRDAVIDVTLLRQAVASNPELTRAVSDIKHFQARRFAGTYFDLLRSELYKPAALFFLEELYSEKDYSERDSQFARIASAMERIFPPQVVKTAVSLAQLHRLTEVLDLAMAHCWLANTHSPEVARYVSAWREVGRHSDRRSQLETVLNIGHELDLLTRTRGLHTMLKLMRGPAKMAGLGSLQRFLESGFDTFAAMGRKGGGTRYFLDSVMGRESDLIERLFSASPVSCETEITQILGQSR
jgi:hypothetical protein